MNDLKSKLPDLNELGTMAGKLYKDLKTSVCEIIDDYKLKHPPETVAPQAPVEKPTETATVVPPAPADKSDKNE